MDIVLKLRELRRLCRLSQQEVAKSSGMGVKTLSSFESGARIRSIKVLQLLSLLQVYDVSPAEFFGGTVDRAIFAELERLNPRETELVRGLRALPDAARVRLEEKFLAMTLAAEVLSEPMPLRAVR